MNKAKTAGGITGGLMLIGIGVLALTDRWWPGIMVVVGVAVIAGKLYRGQYLSSVPIALIFFGIPAVIELGLTWEIYVPLLLIGLGLSSMLENLARNRRRSVALAGENGSLPRFEYSSGFWPIMLLGVGVVWLLGSLGYIPGFNPFALASLWPLLLVGAGLDLLFGRRSVWIGALIGLVMLAIAAGVLFTWPDLLPKIELESAEFSEPLGETTSAELFLELNTGENLLSAPGATDNLVEANLTYLGSVNFSVTGEQAKQIELTQSGVPFAPFLGPLFAEQTANIELSNAVPVFITLENSGGDTQLALQDLQLEGLDLRISGGHVTASLPVEGANIDSDINQSGGDLTFQIGPKAAGVYRVVISGGDLVFDIPDSAAVQVEVVNRSGGDVELPENYVQTESGDDREGTWESPGFTQGEFQMIVILDSISGGDVILR